LNLAQSIKTEPLLFDKILEPIRASLDQLDQHPFSQASKKLFYAAFVRVLLFRVFNQIRSLRDLTLDLKTSQQARLLKLLMLGLSTLHDAFARYPVKWLISLIQHLKANYSLGEVWAADSSYWPIVNQLGWLASQGLKGVRLHLGLSLNTMCAAAFLLTYDTARPLRKRLVCWRWSEMA
jgi:hypothetical protein